MLKGIKYGSALVALTVLSGLFAGCHASVDADPHASSDTTVRRETTVRDTGSGVTKTETKVEKTY